jgi:nitronate monooxygenase
MPDLAASRATTLLGCRLPIVLAGMGGVARSELVAAVTAAGGFGFLGMVRERPELIAREVQRLRALGYDRFGVNIIPAATDAELLARQVETLIDLKVPVVGCFWDLDAPLLRRLKAEGLLVSWQVGSAEEAAAAERAGADLIIAQGVEAGGHVRGRIPLARLLPDVLAAVDVPVLAAGGLARGGDLVTARALGADGIVLGTALMATDEAFAHDFHKRQLLGKSAGDTVLTEDFHINWPPGAAVRVLRTDVTAGRRGSPQAPERVVIGEEEGRPIYLFSTDSPLRSMTGDFAAMALYAGMGVGRIDAIVPAATRIDEIMAAAENLLPQAPRAATGSASPVCYAGEMTGAYMGQLDESEIAAGLGELAALMRRALVAVLAEPQAGPHPPFPDTAYPYAAWSLALGDMAKAVAGSGPAADLQSLLIGMLQKLGAMLPRLPEDARRALLQQLLGFLEAERIRLLQTA